LQQLQFINVRHPSAQLVTGGQPSLQQLEAARSAGVKHVINLRPASEDAGFDEESVLAGMGVQSCRIPVAGAAGLTRAAVEALDAALLATGGEPTMIHCASGNRVGALMALRAVWLQGKSLDEAMDIGRAHGLTAMEPQVLAILRG
jgi:uncharacterized protein (TIGR01244 family)